MSFDSEDAAEDTIREVKGNRYAGDQVLFAGDLSV